MTHLNARPPTVVFTIEVLEDVTGIYWRAATIAGDDERGGDCRKYVAQELREWRLFAQHRFPRRDRIVAGLYYCPLVRLTRWTPRRGETERLKRRPRRRTVARGLALAVAVPLALLIAAIAAIGGVLTWLGLIDWTKEERNTNHED